MLDRLDVKGLNCCASLMFNGLTVLCFTAISPTRGVSFLEVLFKNVSEVQKVPKVQ